MSRYILTASASDDVREIVSYLATEAGENLASRIENELFSCFANLADYPGLGHSRSDLTSRPSSSLPWPHTSSSTAEPVSPIEIHAILHSARDVKRTIRGRTTQIHLP